MENTILIGNHVKYDQYLKIKRILDTPNEEILHQYGLSKWNLIVKMLEMKMRTHDENVIKDTLEYQAMQSLILKKPALFRWKDELPRKYGLSGYISPEGKYHYCEYREHIALSEKILKGNPQLQPDPQFAVDLVNQGWIKISALQIHYSGQFRLKNNPALITALDEYLACYPDQEFQFNGKPFHNLSELLQRL